MSLRKDALIRATHASTAIEGNPLTIEEVSQLAQGRKIMAARKAELEVLNYLREFDMKRFFALDDYYDSDRTSYYRALDSVDPKTVDLTQWLEYFTDGVLISITKVKEKVLRLSLEKHRNEEKGQIPLSERQMKIVEHIISKGRITSGELQKMFNISRQAAHKELLKMIELNLIEQKGVGRAVYYVIK